MPVPQRLNNRYEIKQILGQGGMGIVYRAYDVQVRRDVALKTIRDTPNRAALQMFQRERDVLAAISHPNIIEVFDIGEFEEDGKSKPYFVMPLLPGETLDKLIRGSSQRLTVERAVQIIVDTCRGLQAAHERGLIHRDIKPSNIFVLQDDSVKIIDFGVAHMIDTRASMGAKGTLLYMSPEQLQLKPATAASDLFSLGAVCYEALTRRRPFERATENEIIDAILHQAAPPASALNPAVSQSLSRVIHKAMAKQAWHRYSSAREFAETLVKGLRNEPIEFFDPARIQPRIQRAQRAFEQNDYQFATEILTELEAEGHLETSIAVLRRQIDQALRQRNIAQLLESARTRFEHEEYPLALQKLSEVLQLDPANAAGLGLKKGIEDKLTSQKIEDWFRLARQHIDNHSYAHARQAIQNVLALKPKETRALQLMSEVDRLEQEYVRVRQEKEKLFQAAVEAWQAGEVSAALTKLERVLDLDQKVPDTTSPEHAASYRNLYNQVRSEHDWISNSYAEAKKHLSDRNFTQALAICEACLAKHPGHALFQALKFEIEEKQRQELSARIVEIDREVDAEPDLDRRVAILERAAADYPGEPHFERALRLTRDKRDLVNSIVAKARYNEERGQFSEALAQWEILGTIYSQYPGLSFEVERLVKRRDQQALSEAKARTIEQIDRAVQTGDYGSAMDLLGHAEREFPDDTELTGLKETTRQAMERTGEAEQLLAQGQALCGQMQYDAGLQALRRAHQLAPRNPVVRSELLETLVERARALVDTDWRSAEALVQEALELEPSHALAKSVLTLAQDRKRDEAVAQVFLQARDQRAAGDLEAALAQAEQCLAVYPSEPRLIRLRDILARELSESRETTRRQARRADLEELRRLERESALSSDRAAVGANLDKARIIAAPYAGDSEIQSVVADLERRLSILAPIRKPEPPPEPSAPPPLASVAVVGGPGLTTEPRPAVPSDTDAVPLPPPVLPPPPPMPPSKDAAPAPPPKPPAPPSQPPKKPFSKPLIWGIAGGVGVIAIILLVVHFWPQPPPPPPKTTWIEVQTTPPGARVRIDSVEKGVSNFKVELEPGKPYEVQAEMEGYQTLRVTVTLVPGSTNPIRLELAPLLPALRLFTDLESGKVTLDDQPARELQDGQLTYDAVAAGKHTLRLAGPGSEVTFEFEVAPAAVPAVTDPVTKNLAVLLLSNIGSRARLHASFGPAKVRLDGQEVGQVDRGGLELSNITSGTHELAVGDPEPRRTMIDVGPTPSLTAYVRSDRDVGSLVVMTGEDDVIISLNGREQRRRTVRGQARFTGLQVREYTVRVAKDEFLVDESEQRVAVRKGDEVKVEFHLRKAPPKVAALALNNATPGAELFMDGSRIGTIRPDGSFELANIPPAEHSFELKKDKHQPKQFRRNFPAGETVHLSGADVTLDKAPGRLHLVITPRNAQATVVGPGGSTRKLTSEITDLAEGSYGLTVRAEGYAEYVATVQIKAGETEWKKIELAPSRVITKNPITGLAVLGGAWELRSRPAGRTGPAQAFFRKGGDFVPAPLALADGLLTFTADVSRSHRLRWVVDYIDERNYQLYEMERRNFTHFEIKDSRRTERLKAPHKLDTRDWVFRIEIEASPAGLIHRVQSGGTRVVLESLPNAAKRNFGFYLQGDDEIWIQNITFTPK